MKTISNLLICFLVSVSAFSQNTYEFDIQFIHPDGRAVNGSHIQNPILYSINGGPLQSTNLIIGGRVIKTVQTSSTTSGNLSLYYAECDGTSAVSNFTVPLNTNYKDIVVYCDSLNTGLVCDSSNLNFSQVPANNTSSEILLSSQFRLRHADAIWSYGDGTIDTLKSSWSINQNLYRVGHSYAQPGQYTQCLTVNSPFCPNNATSCKNYITDTSRFCHAMFDIVNINASEVTVQATDTMPNHIYQWKFGDGSGTFTGTNYTHDYLDTGLFSIRLTTENPTGTCWDDTIFSVTITNTSCNADFNVNHNTLNNLVKPLNNSNSKIPYNSNVIWYMGDGNSLVQSAANQTTPFNNDFPYAYDSANTYTITRVLEFAPSNCYDSTSHTITTTGPGLQPIEVILSNPVTDSTTPSAIGRVVAIKYDSIAGALLALDSSNLVCDSTSFISIGDFAKGDYLLKGFILQNEFSYDSIVPTYYTYNSPYQSILWSNAGFVNLGNFTNANRITIRLIQGNNPGGPGFIGGLISQGANKTEAVGDPVPHLDVLLLDDQMEPILATKTNWQGEFEFDDLALGSYYVYPEYPGKTTTPILVELDDSNQDAFNIDFEANDSGIRPADAVGMNEVVASEFLIFPVPAKNQITIQNNSDQPINSIKIYSINGALLFESNELLLQNTSEQIDLNNWASGSYLIRFQGSNFTSVKSFLKK